jgi:hypothetical protein
VFVFGKGRSEVRGDGNTGSVVGGPPLNNNTSHSVLLECVQWMQ